MLPTGDLLINEAILKISETLQRLPLDLFYVLPAMVVVGWFIAFTNRKRA
jgi:hypothetical protein